MEMFITVLGQVTVLILLVGIGVLVTKTKMLNEAVAKGMTDFVLTFVTPCVIIKSFIRKFDRETLKAILISFVIALIIHLGFILISHIMFGKTEEATRRVLRFGMVFANCGFMSLPLQEALLPETGVLYGASFVAIFNFLVWSYGITEISGDKRFMTPKKLIFNPGIIGLTIGILIFILGVPIPMPIKNTVGHLAALNTPIPMIIIGYHLANTDVIKGLKDIKCLSAVVMRLVFMPLLALFGMYICGVRGDMLVSMTISASSPIAAITTMFSAKFDKDTPLSVNMVSISTLLSLATMPLIITLASMIGY